MNETTHETTHETETPVSLLIGGLLVVIFGLFAVMLAIGMGWVGAALLGIALLALAWKVPTSATALRIIMAGWGVVALLGAVFDLLT